MKKRHTPGPWTISFDDGSAAECARPDVIIETEDRHIAFCFGKGRTNDLQAFADYHLIAAAPDLLAACEAAKCLLDKIPLIATERSRRELGVPEQLQAAIAKAEGRAQ